MAHVDPIGNLERVIAFAVWPQNAGLAGINSVAEMIVEAFVEVVIPFDSARIENGEIVRLLAVFEAAHERAPVLLLVAQPNGGKMDPMIDDVFQASLVQRV